MGICKDISTLMRTIGYEFSDVSFLETALTHSSYTNEMKQKGFRAESNESLEFLGDAVLEIVISEYLYDRYAKNGEGALSKLRQTIVCESTLSKIAERIERGEYLNIGSAEENLALRTRKKVLADALEALIAAVYLDDRTNAHGNLYSAVIICLFEKEIELIVNRVIVITRPFCNNLLRKTAMPFSDMILTRAVLSTRKPSSLPRTSTITRLVTVRALPSDLPKCRRQRLRFVCSV